MADKVEFKFSKSYSSYNAGETAAFLPHLADALAKRGLGQIVATKVQPTPASKPIKTVPRNVVTKLAE